ncbi:Uncharacterised protein [Yersinia mollaretii]|nr:Uncharacterised protein [Yersinia mollaretii]
MSTEPITESNINRNQIRSASTLSEIKSPLLSHKTRANITPANNNDNQIDNNNHLLKK